MNRIVRVLALLLAVTLFLTACGEKDPLTEQLLSGPWIAEFSEGTAASYTFHKDGTFLCDTTITVGEKSGYLQRSGSWRIEEQNGMSVVILQYPDVNYSSQIHCILGQSGSYTLELAGSILHQ